MKKIVQVINDPYVQDSYLALCGVHAEKEEIAIAEREFFTIGVTSIFVKNGEVRDDLVAIIDKIFKSHPEWRGRDDENSPKPYPHFLEHMVMSECFLKPDGKLPPQQEGDFLARTVRIPERHHQTVLEELQKRGYEITEYE